MDEFWRETFRSLMAPLRSVRFSLATLLLATCFVASCLAVWVNREPWEIVASVPLPDFQRDYERGRIAPMAKDGQILFERSYQSHRLTVWNWHTGELTPVPFPEAEILLETAPAAGRFLTADRSGTARVRQIGSAHPLVELPHWVFPTAKNLRLSADGNRVAGSGPDGAVWLYELQEQKESSFPAKSTSPNKVSLEFSSDGHWLLAYEENGHGSAARCAGWQLIDCNQCVVSPAPMDVEDAIREANGCNFLPNSPDYLLAGTKWWRIGTTELTNCPGKPALYRSNRPLDVMALQTEGRTRWGTLEVWSKDLGRRLGTVPANQDSAPTMWRISRTGGHVILNDLHDADRGATLWETATGRRLYVFPELLVVEFLDENRILAFSGLRKSEVQVWRRRRPEYAWGIVALPEFWLMPIFLIATVFSVRRDRRKLWSAPL